MRAALFDAAGTLLRLREPVGATYARLARPFGVSLPEARLDDAFHRVFPQMPAMVFPGESPEATRDLERRWWRELVRRAFRAADGTAAFTDFEACFARLFDHYAGADAWTACPGAEAGLVALRDAGLRTGVVSNFDHRLPGLLAVFGLAPLLDVVVRPADVGVAKPDPRIFAHALARLDVPARAAVYVGDHAEDDLAGATGAGLHAIDVASLASLEALPARIARLDEET